MSPLIWIPGGPQRAHQDGVTSHRPADREPRTFVTSTVDFPVIRLQVGRPGRLHQQVLHVSPGQLVAAMTQGTCRCSPHRSIMLAAQVHSELGRQEPARVWACGSPGLP